jgi:hypothetical protein
LQARKGAIIALVALVAIGGCLAWLTSGILQTQQNLPNSGKVADQVTGGINVGVYSDAAATVNCTGLNWGTISAGNTVTRTVYVKNTGNTTETLSMIPSGWTPAAASSALTLGWNREGTQLSSGQTVAATFSLTVAEETGNLSSFNFNIAISGTAA